MVWLSLALVFVYAVSSPLTSCHIHSPGEVIKEQPKYVSGPYPSSEACEAENHKRFGGAGRCHCIFGRFSTGMPMDRFIPIVPTHFEALPDDMP
jgi:hypothetical protein